MPDGYFVMTTTAIYKVSPDPRSARSLAVYTHGKRTPHLVIPERGGSEAHRQRGYTSSAATTIIRESPIVVAICVTTNAVNSLLGVQPTVLLAASFTS